MLFENFTNGKDKEKRIHSCGYKQKKKNRFSVLLFC